MPFVSLKPGALLNLNAGNHDAVMNPSDREGQYVVAFNLMPLSVQHTIPAHSNQPFVVPEGGATVQNNGAVELTVSTPGL
jgi:hypothetical protein